MTRTVNPGLAEYMKTVDNAVSRACGVTYGDIYKDLHGDITVMRETYESGLPAEDFVTRVIADGNLAPVGDADVASVRALNLRRASLVAFAAENPQWLMGADRSLFTANDDGELFRMAPTLSKDGRGWGYAIDKVVSGSPSVDENGTVTLPEGAEFERMGAGLDIEDAIVAYETRLAPSAPGMH
jgi:hypothetical protein